MVARAVLTDVPAGAPLCRDVKLHDLQDMCVAEPVIDKSRSDASPSQMGSACESVAVACKRFAHFSMHVLGCSNSSSLARFNFTPSSVFCVPW
jgi:hypothetical protein